MVKKEEDKNYQTIFNLSTIIILAVMLAIPITFFLLKSSVVQGETFGLSEITFSIIVSIVSTSFILWDKKFTLRNPHLGAIIGILTVAIFDYAVFFRYSGPYTTFFITLTSILVIAYLGYYFIFGLKNKKREKENYYEENPEA